MDIQPIQRSGVIAYIMTNSAIRKLYQRLQAMKVERPYECLLTAGPKAGHTRAICRGREITDIKDAEGSVRDQKPHRLIVVSNTNEAKDDCVTVSGMKILLSWILAGMTAQTHATRHEGVSGPDFHMAFPVLTISFSMPTHTRVIQATFKTGQLNIQFTKFYNFDEPESEYIETMNDFLKWADAIPCGNTLAVHGDAKLAEEFHVVFDEKRQRASKPTQALSLWLVRKFVL